MGLTERGLGTALSSILGQWSGADHRAGAPLHALIPPFPAAPLPSTFGQFADATLDALLGVFGVDLAALLFRTPGSGYQLTGRRRPRSPRVDGLALFDAVRAQIGAGLELAEFSVGETSCLGFVEALPSWEGALVLGRARDGFDRTEVARAVPLCRVLGSLLARVAEAA